jgi:hypothetical protein
MISSDRIEQLKESWMKIHRTDVLNEWEFWNYTIAITKEVEKIKQEEAKNDTE